MISSVDFTSRASSITCCAVADGDALGLERGEHRRLHDVDAERHVGDALGPEDVARSRWPHARTARRPARPRRAGRPCRR